MVFVYLFEGPLSERGHKKGKEAIVLFPVFEKEKAAIISVKGPIHEVRLEKKGEGWLISNTDGFTADMKLVNSALDTIKNLTRENIASRNPKKQELFEVNKVKGIEVNVFSADQKTTARFYIGKTGPDFFSTYLRKEGSDEVVLSGGNIKSTFDKSIKDWRDKTIFSFPPDTITQLTLKTSEKEIVLDKDKEGAWHIAKPEKIKAKKEKVEDIGNTFASLKAIDFAEDEDLKKYQLDKPEITIIVILQDKVEKRLLIGEKHKDKSQYYVKNQAKKTIFLVGKYQIDKMNVTLKDLKKEEKTKEDEKAKGKKADTKKEVSKGKKEDKQS